MADSVSKQIVVADMAALDVLAAKIAARLRGSETLELLADLGGGKTAFTRCLAKHLRSADAVASPSFTIENIYRCQNFDIHHFDFYRLDDPGVCAFELQEALADPDKLVIVEWSRIVADLLPKARLAVEIAFDSEAGEDSRRFTFKAPAELTYLMEDI